MGHWQLPTGPNVESYATRTTTRNTFQNLVTGAANTKGAWVQLVSSLPYPTSRILVTVGSSFVAATNTSSLVDIGIGAAGSEQVIIADLGAGYAESVSVAPHQYDLPFVIPAGIRVAARAQSVTATKTIVITFEGYGGSPNEGSSPYTSCETFGANTATSQGITLTPGLANVAGAWAVLSAATTNPISGVFVGAQGAGNTNLTAADVLVELGVGAASSEVSLTSGLYLRVSASELLYSPVGALIYPRQFRLPAGIRLVARLTSTVASQALDFTFHGMR